MKAMRVMTRDVYSVAPSTSLFRAHHLMTSLGVRHLPVVLDGQLCGILSDRDLLRAGDEAPDGRMSFPEGSVAAVMTTRPITASSEASVGRLAELMLTHRISCLPIVGPKMELVGLVTTTDLLTLLRETPMGADRLPFDFRIHGPEAQGNQVSA